MNINKNFNIAKNAIKLAGAEVLNFYGKLENIEYKQNNSPVTQADLASNKVLLELLKKTNIPILSEEGADDLSRLKEKKVWIIDPLDGTKDFIQETGDFTIMVALVEKNKYNNFRPIMGLIYQPLKKILYSAQKTEGAWQEHNNKKEKIHVSKKVDWNKIVILTSRNHSTDLEKKIAEEKEIECFKTFGSSLKTCFVASSVGDISFNPGAHTWEWDVCASDIIVHEAGGKFSDCKGNIFNYNKKNPRNLNGYLASNAVIYNKVIKYINA